MSIKFRRCEQFSPLLHPVANCPGSEIKIRPPATNGAGTEMAARKRKLKLCGSELQVPTDDDRGAYQNCNKYMSLYQGGIKFGAAYLNQQLLKLFSRHTDRL